MKPSEVLVELANRCADPQLWHHGGAIGSPGKPRAQCVLGHLGEILGVPRLELSEVQPPGHEPCIDYMRIGCTREVEALHATRPLKGKKNGPFCARADRVAANNDSVSHPELMAWLYRAQVQAKESER